MSETERAPRQPGSGPPRQPVLVLYAREDEGFACGYLAPALGKLEAGPPLALLLGGDELTRIPVLELEELLRGRRAILLVMTPAFLATPWLRLAETLASHQAALGDAIVVTLRLAPCQLPLHLEISVKLELCEPPAEGPDDHADADCAPPDAEARAQQELARWNEELERLLRQLRHPPPAPRVLPCPYPGMRSFTATEAAYYHGRGQEIDEVTAQLEAGARELLLVGPSGSGKSSLLAAGVLPRLRERAAASSRSLFVRWFRPGAAPTAQLLEALRGEQARAATTRAPRADATPPPAPAAAQAPGPDAVDAALQALLLAAPTGELVLIVDQLEELFAQASPQQQRAFAEALRPLRAHHRVRIILAIRADFFAELLGSQLWSDSSRAQHNLASLRGAALRDAIELPARALGVYFEAGLIELLLEHASDEPGVLPLLQETLFQLWKRRRLQLLSMADYEAMGKDGRSGLVTALALHADQTLALLPAARRLIAQRILLRLVAFGEGRPHTRRRQRRGELRSCVLPGHAATGGGLPPPQALDGPRAAELQAVIDALASARLLSLDRGELEGDPEDDAIDLCHDALVTAWPQLAGWISARQVDEERRRKLEARAREWLEAGAGDSGLLDARALAATLSWLDSDGAREIGWSAEAQKLVEHSQRQLDQARRRQQRRLRIYFVTVGVSAIIATVLATLALLQNRKAVASEKLARENQQRATVEAQRATREAARATAEAQRAGGLLAVQYLKTARELWTAQQLQRALPYLVESRTLGHDSLLLRSMFHLASRPRLLAELPVSSDWRGAALSRDGTWAITLGADRRAQVWHVQRGEPVLLPHARDLLDAELSADGSRALTTTRDTRLHLWDLSVTPPRELPLANDAVAFSGFRSGRARLSPDDAWLVAAASDGVRLWSTRTGEAVGGPLSDRFISHAAFDATGGRIAAIRIGCTFVWSVATRALEAKLCQQDSPRLSQFGRSRDGGEVLTMSYSSSQQLGFWEPATGKLRQLTLAGQRNADVTMLTQAPAGPFAAIAGQSLWLGGGGWPAPVQVPHPCEISALAMDQAGTRAVTLCADNLIRVWDPASGELLTSVESAAGSLDLRLSADGQRLLTMDRDRTARIWDLGAMMAPRRLTLSSSYGALLSPDGAVVVVRHGAALELWSTATGQRSATLASDLPYTLPLQFSRDGRRLVVFSEPRVQVWDVATARVLLTVTAPKGWQTLAWSADGNLLAVAGPSTVEELTGPGRSALAPQYQRLEHLQLWDVRSGKGVGPTLRFEGTLQALVLSEDGRWLLAGSTEGTVRRWSLDTWQAQTLLQPHPDQPAWDHLRFSPDGRWLATTSAEHRLRVWDLTRPSAPRELVTGAITRVRFCDGAARLVTVGDRQVDPGLRPVQLWDLASGRQLVVPGVDPDSIVDFEQQGCRRVITQHDDTAQLHDAQTGELLGWPRAHAGRIRWAELTDDGAWLAVWSMNDRLTLWDATLDASSVEAWQQRDAHSSFPPLRLFTPPTVPELTPVPTAAPVTSTQAR